MTEAVKKTIKDALTSGSIFDIELSGKDGWIRPDCVITNYDLTATSIDFHITIALPPDMPGVVFYDKEKRKEDFHFDNPLPLIKIALKPDIKIDCPPSGQPNYFIFVVLKVGLGKDENNWISQYNFLRNIKNSLIYRYPCAGL